MIRKFLSTIIRFVRKTPFSPKESIRTLAIFTIVLLPASLVGTSSPSSTLPSGWTAHNPIIVRTTPTGDGLAPLVIAGLNPSLIRKAYGIELLGSNGAGKTIAIVDAYGNPNMASDLTTFNTQFGLPACTLTIAYPNGTPPTNTGWAIETALDVEWAHAIAPAANILLVVAPSNSLSNLLTAVDYATNHGADVVSMSWGGAEWSTEAVVDSHFNHAGVTYVASSGDSGTEVNWPAVSSYVVGVGGTTLNIDTSGNYVSESAWSGSGGGTSAYVARPGYQEGFQSAGNRGVPDVAFDADPNSGVAVYCSQPSPRWMVVGGTSLSAPCWAGLFVLGGLNGVPSVYAQASTSPLYTRNYHDVTTGSNGLPAGTGYDLVTGLGSPKSNNLVPTTATKLGFTKQPSTSNTAGIAFAIQPVVAILDSSGNTITSSTASVSLSITPGTGTAGAKLSGATAISAVNGVATFSDLSIDKAGSGYKLTATSSGLTSTDSGTITVVAGPVSKLSVSGYVSPSTAGTSSNFTVTAQDGSGNTVTAYTGTVHFTSSDPQAMLPANYTFVSGDNGAHTFSTILKTSGSQSVTATDTVTNTINGTQNNITVNPDIAAQISVETAADGSGSVVATQNLHVGATLTVYSVTRDQFNNYVANAPSSSWSLINKTVRVADGDLVPAGDLKSAVMTGHVVGTGTIHAAVEGLNSIDSGTITVTTSASIDFDGDGKNDYVVYRPITGQWFVIPSTTGIGIIAAGWGAPTDIPVPSSLEVILAQQS